ncbi:alpha/beta hydrolase family protein [Thermogemmatispora sp.]|uniref:alpha/beta hydrolase family protein n=1 Tax=Thermogemmatispora sp. TaxID=1968838 RepID=UPI001D2DF968|nr:alpha/beta hydrolase [Thermogemmatispora sp.]MBX5448576.1 alpha/beta hydrolase [Thermogemmatispora sp.]
MSTTDQGAAEPRLIRLGYGPQPLHFGELRLPSSPGPYPVVVLIHGGFWRNPYDLSLMKGLAEDLTAHGLATWNIEYRRLGDAGGGWPGTLQDVALAVDFLCQLAESYGLDRTRLISLGHSAGGQLALWLAAWPLLAQQAIGTEQQPLRPERAKPLRGAVSLAGVVDLEAGWQRHLGRDAVAELLGGSPAEVPERYRLASPAALLPLGVPQVLIHGTADDRVPVEVSRSYAERARLAGDQVTLIELPNVDHFALIEPSSAAWQTTRELVLALCR